jgi:hypothetical protein
MGHPHPADARDGRHAFGRQRRAEPRLHEGRLIRPGGPYLRYDEGAVVGGAGGVREQPGRPVPRLGVRVDVEVPADRGVIAVVTPVNS